MDIRQLQYLLQIVRSQSFTKAAERLHITQPTISKAVKNLEDELGVQLFIRSGREIALTDAGKVIAQGAGKIVDQLEEIENGLAELVSLQKGSISLGLPPMVGAYFFPSVIRRFREHHPGISLSILEDGSKRIQSAVAEGELDMGVVLLSAPEDQFHSFPVVEEKLQVVLPAGHALAGRGEIKLSELAAEPFIMFRQDFTLHDRMLEACREAGFQPDIVCESSQWDFIGGMVAAGLGIAMLPETICKQLAPGAVSVVKLTEPLIPWRLVMIWRKEGYLSFAARKWLSFAREQLFNPTK
ncbi:LysR family transcriptional regulator [Paenibacillus sp. CAU 1782]